MAKKAQAQPGGERDSQLLKVTAVARMLQTSVRSVWRWSSTGILPPPISIGRAKRWELRAIEAFIARQSKEAV